MRIWVFLLVLVSVLIGVREVWAQERTITGAEYNSKRDKAFSALQNATYREKRTVDVRESAELPWKPYSYTVDEYIRPDRSHTQITMLILGHIEPQTDLIRIGDTTYIKRPNGVWFTDRYRTGIAAKSTPDAAKPVNEYKQLGDEVIAGKLTVVLQKTCSYDVEIEGQQRSAPLVEKLWLDKNGGLLKTETVTRNLQVKPFRFSRSTSLYEYDPTIKIEAPVK